MDSSSTVVIQDTRIHNIYNSLLPLFDIEQSQLFANNLTFSSISQTSSYIFSLTQYSDCTFINLSLSKLHGSFLSSKQSTTSFSGLSFNQVYLAHSQT